MNYGMNRKITNTRLGADKLGLPTYILSLDDGGEVVIPHPFYKSLGKPAIGETLVITVSTKTSEVRENDSN